MTALLPRGAGATIRGRKHVSEGSQCQDVVVVERSGRSAVVAAVSDGAGSAKFGGEGAAITTKLAVSYLKRLKPALYISSSGAQLLVQIREAITFEAGQKKAGTRDYAATLLATVVRKTKSETFWFALHIGDGAIAGDFGNGLEVVSKPENGEYSNTTFFVTDDNAEHHLRTYSGRCASAAFALMTDGAAESLYHRNLSSFASAVSTLFSWCKEERPRTFDKALSSNLASLIASRTTDDAGLAIISA